LRSVNVNVAVNVNVNDPGAVCYRDAMLGAVLLAVALAMDATAVAAVRGAAGVSAAGALRMGVVFGAFQAGMAAAGWGLGAGAARWIEAWDHWVAFGLLAIIGGKMLIEAIRGRGDEPPPEIGWRAIVLLAIATSIDALAAGVTLPLLAAPPALTVALIGGVTAVLSLAGARAGAALGARIGRGLEVAGGLALIAIGVKIVFDHT
jgi:putative Mn2+ efflux pump MntP